MLGTIASLADIGGQLLGGLGAGKAKAPTTVSGFASLGSDQKNFANEDVWNRIKDVFLGGYRRVPLRTINESDTDPLFGSTARQGIAKYKSDLAAMIAANGTSPVAEDTAGLEAKMMARQFLESGGGEAPKYADKRRDQYRAGLYTDKGLGEIGKYLLDKEKRGGGTRYGEITTPLYSKFAEALNVSPNLEAMKRKGLA
jgi:hypothetical protein